MKQPRGENTLLWINAAVGRHRYGVLLLAVLQAALSLISLGYAWLFRALIDSAAGKDLAALKRAAILLLLCMCLQILLRAAVRFLEENGRAGIENALKGRLFSCILRKDYSSVTAIHSGEWMNRLTSDTRVIADNMIQILPGLTGMLVRLVGAVILMIILLPQFAMILVPGGILVILLTFAFRSILKKLHKKIQESDGALRIFLTERLGSLMVLKAFGKEETAAAEAGRYMDEHKAARMKRNHFSNFSNVGFNFLLQGAYIVSAVYCAYGIFQGTISFGTLTAIMHLVSQIQSPFANISGFLPKFYAMLASAERLIEAEHFPDELPDAEEAGISRDENRKTPAAARSEEEIRQYYENELLSLGFRDLSFAYPDAQNEERTGALAVRDCSLEIGKGQFIGIMGASGCGKSTLLKLLMCFYPAGSGERYLKDAGGKQPLDASWRGLFSYVPQGNHLMSGTIREAVAFGDPEDMKKEEQIRRALYIACADGFVDELPQGPDTVLGERGAGLSEGQMQRIAIARAVFSNRPVMLLDEATSSLDETTERTVLDRLRTLTDVTVLIVTHRRAALSITDRIIECREDEGTWQWRMRETAENEGAGQQELRQTPGSNIPPERQSSGDRGGQP